MRLQEKVAFLEEAVARTAKTVEELNVQMLSLRRDVADLRRQASPLGDAGPQGTDPPPHY